MKTQPIKKDQLHYVLLALSFLVLLLIVFSSKSLGMVYAADIVKNNGSITRDLLIQHEGELEAGIPTGGRIELVGNATESSDTADAISLTKEINALDEIYRSAITFSDPQLIEAINNRRLKVDVLVTGQNEFKILADGPYDGGTWVDNHFDVSSILEGSFSSYLQFPQFNDANNVNQKLQVDFSNVLGSFTDRKVLENLSLHPNLITDAISGNKVLKIGAYSAVTLVKEPSSPGLNVLGIQITTKITSIKLVLKFEKLEVEIIYGGDQGKVKYNNREYDKPTGSSSHFFDIDFELAEIGEDQSVLNKPVFEGAEHVFGDYTYYFIGWEQLSTTNQVVQSFPRTIIESNFLEEIESGTRLRYRASFRAVYLEFATSVSFEYGLSEAPHFVLQPADVDPYQLSLVERYESTPGNGDYDSEYKPTDVGSYKYTVQVAMGEKIGESFLDTQISITVTRNFAITEAQPILSIYKLNEEGTSWVRLEDTDDAILYFGQPLSYLNLQFVAEHANSPLLGGQWNYLRTDNLESETISENDVFTRGQSNNILESTPGAKNQYIKFTPSDTKNYKTTMTSFTLEVVLDQNALTIKNQDENYPKTRDVNFIYSIEDSVDGTVKNNLGLNAEISEPVLRLRFDITFTDVSGHYFFLGIAQKKRDAINHDYFDLDDGNGGSILTFDYYFKDVKTSSVTDVNAEVLGSFYVDFVKDITAGVSADDANIYVKSYEGVVLTGNLNPVFEEQRQQGSMIYKNRKYYEYEINETSYLPYKIGTHKMEYDVYLHLSQEREYKIGKRTLSIIVEPSDIRITRQNAQDFNPSTGWSSGESLDLLSRYYDANQDVYRNVKAGGVQKYYYSIDDKESFHEIDGDPNNADGCPLFFNIPALNNTSKEYKIDVIAVHEDYGEEVEYGGVTYKVVGRSILTYISKIDTANLQITDVKAMSYTWGQWTNNDIELRITANHGGSGIRFLYKVGTTGQYQPATTDWISVDISKVETPAVYDVTISTSAVIDGDVYFRIENSVGGFYNLDTPKSIRIDKKTVSLNIDQTPLYKWHKSNVSVEFNISHSGSDGLGAGMKAPYEDGDGSVYVTSSTGSDPKSISLTENGPNKYKLVLLFEGEGKEIQYSVYVINLAGNTSNTVKFWFSIDKSSASEDWETEYSLGTSSEVYEIGTWVNESVTITFDIIGGKTAQLRIQENVGTKSNPVWENKTSFMGSKNLDGNMYLYYELIVTGTSEGINKDHHYRIINEAGEYKEIEIGEIKIDKVKPTIELPDPISNWILGPVTVKIKVFNMGTEILRSDIKYLKYGFGVYENSLLQTAVKLPKEKEEDDFDTYEIEVRSPAELFVKVEDEAGNINQVTGDFARYKVDPISFTDNNFTYVAYKGGGNITDSSDQTVQPTELYDFSKTEWSREHIRIEFKFDRIPASGLYFYRTRSGGYSDEELDVYLPTEEEVFDFETLYGDKFIYTLYFSSEGSIQRGIKIKTGNQESFDVLPALNSYFNIDKTPPNITDVSKKSNGAAHDFTAYWTAHDSELIISVSDSYSGIDSIILYKNVGIESQTFEDHSHMLIPLSGEGNESRYQIIFDSYGEYKLIVKDMAGIENERSYTVLIDKFETFKIDTLEWFRFDGTEYVEYEDNENRWLESDEKVKIVLKYELLNGATEIGLSGLFVDFKRGRLGYESSYMVEGSKQEFVHNSFNKTFTMIIEENQVEEYVKFKLRSGSGIFVESDDVSIFVRKDTSTATFSVSATLDDTAKTPYAGQWTSLNVDVRLSLTFGPGAESVSYAYGDAFEEDLDWQNLGNIIAVNQQIFTVKVNQSKDAKMFFRLKMAVAEDSYQYYEDGIELKVDKGIISPKITAKFADDSIYLGNIWTDETVILILSMDGDSISGLGNTISLKYGTELILINIKETGLPYEEEIVMPAPGDVRERAYKLEIGNNAGVVEESPIFVVKQTAVTPSFAFTVKAEGNIPKNIDGWYLSRVELIFNTEFPNNVDFFSSYVYMIRKKLPDADDYGEWEEIVLVNNRYYIEDEYALTTKGGSHYHYSIGVFAQNGKSKIVNYESDGGASLNIMIDQANYVAHITQSINGIVSNTNYATLLNSNFSAKRGELVNLISVTPKSGFYYKSIYYNDGTTEVNESFTKIDKSNMRRAFGPSGYTTFKVSLDVELVISYYCEVEISIVNPYRFIQDGSNLNSLTIEAEDPSFTSAFGPLKLDYEEKPEQPYVEITPIFYKGETPLYNYPTELGGYHVSFSHNFPGGETDFIISATKHPIFVSYFVGGGTIRDPFLVASIDDFYAISYYMRFSSSYVGDPYDYLIAAAKVDDRFKSYFLQTANLVFPSGMFPVQGMIANANRTGLVSIQDPQYPDETYVFQGHYDGNGFELGSESKIWLTETTKWSGLFSEIQNAVLRNIAVNYNVGLESSDVNFGFLVGTALNSVILYSRSLGVIENSISVSGVNIGGLVGLAQASFLADSFSDVSIIISKSSGNIGGMLGKSINSYIINSYFVGKILIDDVVLAKFGMEGEDSIYVGGLIGYHSFVDAEITKIENHIRQYNMAINGETISGDELGTGNNFLISESKLPIYSEKLITHLLADETVIIRPKEEASKIVKELMLLRVEEARSEVAFMGAGTYQSPILLDNLEKLGVIEKVPWAYFKQVEDIEFDLSKRSQSYGDFSYILTTGSFVGNYDGNGKELKFLGTLKSKSSYMGLFNVLGGVVKNLTITGLNLVSDNTSTVNIGAIAGLLLKGSKIENIDITGQIWTKNTEFVSVGALFAEGEHCEIKGVASNVKIIVEGANKVVAGGLAGVIGGESSINEVLFTSSLDIFASVFQHSGRLVAYVSSDSVTGANIRLIRKGLSVNGFAQKQNLNTLFVKNVHDTLEYLEYSYEEALGSEETILIGMYHSRIKTHLSRISPLTGSGTVGDPYLISNYRDLLLLNNDTTAHYKLEKNIRIGDYDGDGEIDSGYENNFEPLGGNMPFIGSFNGNQKIISDLTKPLFNVNNGVIYNLQVDCRYMLVPTLTAQHPSYASSCDKEEIIFGAIAKVNLRDGIIIGSYASGIVDVNLPGAKVTIGGIVGINYSIEVKANTVNFETFNVVAFDVIVGGIIGSLSNHEYNFILQEKNMFMPINKVNVIGLNAHVGIIIGYYNGVFDAGEQLIENDFASMEIYVNGEEIKDLSGAQIGNFASE